MQVSAPLAPPAHVRLQKATQACPANRNLSWCTASSHSPRSLFALRFGTLKRSENCCCKRSLLTVIVWRGAIGARFETPLVPERFLPHYSHAIAPHSLSESLCQYALTCHVLLCVQTTRKLIAESQVGSHHCPMLLPVVLDTSVRYGGSFV